MATTTAKKTTATKPAAKTTAGKPAAKKTTTARKPAAKKTTTARKPAAKKTTATKAPVAKKNVRVLNVPTVELPKFEALRNGEMPKFDTRKVELPAAKLPTGDDVRAEIADLLDDAQEAVVAAPARAQEVVVDLRERYAARVDTLVDRFEVRTADLRVSIEDALETVRERVGR